MNQQSVRGIVEQTAVDLFAAYQMHDVTRESDAALAAAPTIAGHMRFERPRPGGAVVIASTSGFFAKTRPSAKTGANVTEEGVLARDWARELANQLLGRLANRFVAFGIQIEFGVVEPPSGRIDVDDTDTGRAQPLIFRIGNDTVWVWLNGEGIQCASEASTDGGGWGSPQVVGSGLDVAAPSSGAAAPAREGDIIFF